MQRCVACVTADVLVIERVLTAFAPASQRADIAFGSTTARLRGRTNLSFSIAAHVESRLGEEGWAASVAGYYLTISDAAEQEIVAYHWHPQGRSPIIEPHLHIGAGARAARAELSRAHLPTGAITLADVVALLIDGFGVRPRRADWRDVLARARPALQSS